MSLGMEYTHWSALKWGRKPFPSAKGSQMERCGGLSEIGGNKILIEDKKNDAKIFSVSSAWTARFPLFEQTFIINKVFIIASW